MCCFFSLFFFYDNVEGSGKKCVMESSGKKTYRGRKNNTFNIMVAERKTHSLSLEIVTNRERERYSIIWIRKTSRNTVYFLKDTIQGVTLP